MNWLRIFKIAGNAGQYTNYTCPIFNFCCKKCESWNMPLSFRLIYKCYRNNTIFILTGNMLLKNMSSLKGIKRNLNIFQWLGSHEIYIQTQSQMLWNPMGNLPAKFWRLTGCTNIAPIYFILSLRCIAFRICMACYRRKPTVSPGKFFLSKNDP